MEFPIQKTEPMRQRRFGGRGRPRTSGSSRISSFSRLLEAAAILLRTYVCDPVWFSPDVTVCVQDNGALVAGDCSDSD